MHIFMPQQLITLPQIWMCSNKYDILSNILKEDIKSEILHSNKCEVLLAIEEENYNQSINAEEITNNNARYINNLKKI